MSLAEIFSIFLSLTRTLDAAESAALFPSKILTLRNRTERSSCWASAGHAPQRSTANSITSPARAFNPDIISSPRRQAATQLRSGAAFFTVVNALFIGRSRTRRSGQLIPSMDGVNLQPWGDYAALPYNSGKMHRARNAAGIVGTCVSAPVPHTSNSNQKTDSGMKPLSTPDCNYLALEYDPARAE